MNPVDFWWAKVQVDFIMTLWVLVVFIIIVVSAALIDVFIVQRVRTKKRRKDNE